MLPGVVKFTHLSFWLLVQAGDTCDGAGNFDLDLSDQFAEDVTVAEKVKESFDGLWDVALSPTSFVYSSLSDIGLLLAVVTVTVFIVRWGRELLESGISSKSFGEIIWPLVVAVFLSNNGQILASTTRAMQNYVQEQEETIVNGAFLDVFIGETLESAFRQLVGITTVPLGIGSILAQCTSHENPAFCLSGPPVYEGEEIERFESGALQQAICALNPYVESGENPKLAQLSKELEKEQEKLHSILKNEVPGSSDEEDTFTVGIPPEIYKLMSASEDSGLMQFFMGSGAAFVWLTELALFITALLGPLALGLSLLPVGGKAVFAWLTGFLSVAFAKLFYFILTGLSSIVVLDAIQDVSLTDFVDSILVGIFVGALAPLLSLAVCVSGGRAVFQSLVGYVVPAVDSTVRRRQIYRAGK
ncbi:MAG: hypothetical protein ACFB4I_13025 [Cyanophyceae cyanobacterium]